ncbi:hypothetical protein BD414DRAFT_508631 [Trametes punicea]|nr:hypothetical protein BD414DRAFT_508631 [Trametes punicea]
MSDDAAVPIPRSTLAQTYIQVERMCDALKFPRAHARFNELYKRLDGTYSSVKKGAHIALQALTVVTHHGGLPARQEIAGQPRTLIKVVQDHSNGPKVAELVISTVTHAKEAVVASPTQHCPQDCKAVPSMLNFIAAMTWSKNYQLPRGSVHRDSPPADSRCPAPNPKHLSDILMDYGPEKAEMSLTVSTSIDYQKAMMQAVQDRDMYALEKKLSDIIQRPEFAIAEGGWQMRESDRSMQLADQSSAPGLPFTRWTDALSLSAKALRAKGTPANLCGGHCRDGVLHASTMGAVVEEGLRAVKKGLKCKNVTAFVRNQMLWRAANHAGQRGLAILTDAMEGDMHARAEGTTSSKTYMSEAPPAGRNVLAVVSWYIILTILIFGPDFGEDLAELELLCAVHTEEDEDHVEFMNHMGYPIAKTQLNLTREILLCHYTEGAKDWGCIRQTPRRNARTASMGMRTATDMDITTPLRRQRTTPEAMSCRGAVGLGIRAQYCESAEAAGRRGIVVLGPKEELFVPGVSPRMSELSAVFRVTVA